jgi:hypothetical protein
MERRRDGTAGERRGLDDALSGPRYLSSCALRVGGVAVVLPGPASGPLRADRRGGVPAPAAAPVELDAHRFRIGSCTHCGALPRRGGPPTAPIEPPSKNSTGWWSKGPVLRARLLRLGNFREQEGPASKIQILVSEMFGPAPDKSWAAPAILSSCPRPHSPTFRSALQARCGRAAPGALPARRRHARVRPLPLGDSYVLGLRIAQKIPAASGKR